MYEIGDGDRYVGTWYHYLLQHSYVKWEWEEGKKNMKPFLFPVFCVKLCMGEKEDDDSVKKVEDDDDDDHDERCREKEKRAGQPGLLSSLG